MDSPLRLIVYDPTDTGSLAAPFVRDRGADGTSARGRFGLSPVWRLGARAHQRIGRAADAYAASSWRAALHWAVDLSRARGVAIDELQVWGHGGWGFMLLGDDRLDAHASAPAATRGDEVDALRRALAPGALVWLRCCSAFGAPEGRAFAQALAARLATRVAGHTFIIGAIQSGLRGLLPGHTPDWSAEEGIAEGTPERPLRAHGSGLRKPRTITCFQGDIPDSWFT